MHEDLETCIVLHEQAIHTIIVYPLISRQLTRQLFRAYFTWELLCGDYYFAVHRYYICYDRSAKAKLITKRNTNHPLGLVALLVYDHIQLGEWALHDICSYILNIWSHIVLMESNHLRPINWESTPRTTTAYDSMQVNYKYLPRRGLYT